MTEPSIQRRSAEARSVLPAWCASQLPGPVRVRFEIGWQARYLTPARASLVASDKSVGARYRPEARR